MAQTDEKTQGVPKLLCQLCSLALGTHKKYGLSQPSPSYESKLKNFKLKAWNSFFSLHHGPHLFESVTNKFNQLSEVDEIHAYAYKYHTQRAFDKASELEHLLNLLNHGAESDVNRSVLRLLLSLADTADTDKPSVLGHTHRVPQAHIATLNEVILPAGPLQYGDTKLHTVDDCYMHFPAELFEQPGLHSESQGADDKMSLMQIFRAKPGSHLQGDRVFQSKVTPGDKYEQCTYNSLYGALVQSTTTSIDLDLDLPDLADNQGPPEIKIPKLFDNSEDEGFGSSAMSSGELTPDDSGVGLARLTMSDVDGEIWQRALQYVPSNHRVWENRGGVAGPTALPYMTEAGPAALDHLWCVRMEHLSLIDPKLHVPARRELHMGKLITDVINLLLGVPSTSFLLNEETDELYISPGLCMTGMTPEGLAMACQPAIQCGTNYRRLNVFSHSVLMDSFYHAGLIFQAFTGAITKYLQHYRGCILSIPDGKTLTEINFLLHRVYQQIRFLADLCHCVPPSEDDTEDQTFPTGVHLLSYLYKHTLEAAGSQHYSMMLSLLNTSAGPYLMFVQDWVFHGFCRDTYGEFMIQVNEDYLGFRDKHYWTQGYVMLAKDAVTSVPLFLSDLANDIFTCGKSINLLKLCAPQHFLFTVDQEVPRVMITFSEEEITSTELTCQGYLSRMQQIAKMKTISRNQMIQKAERAKQELIILARRAASMELEKIHAKAMKQKQAADTRKRLMFTELKHQMEQDLKRRASDRDKKKEDDKAWMQEFSKQEVLEAGVDDKLEKQAREELIEYYAKLSTEATLREQRALWKVRRGRLDDARQNFLLQEQAKLAEEMQEFRSSSHDDYEPVFSPTLSDQNVLPNWAREGLKTAAPGFELDSLANLPSWAKKGLNSEDGDVIRLGSSDLEQALDTGEPGVSDQMSLRKSETDDQMMRHVSDSSVGDVMRAEPVVRPEVEGIRHLGVQRPDKHPDNHPSASSIQTLIYTKTENSKTSAETHTVHVSEENEQKTSQVGNLEPVVEIPETSETSVTQADSEGNDVKRVPDVDGQSPKPSVAELVPKLTPKPKIRLMADKHATTETTEETVPKASVRMLEGTSVLAESKPDVQKAAIKHVQGRCINSQSEEAEQRSHTKLSENMSATKQSEETLERVHLKTVENRHANLQSQEVVHKPGTRANQDMHATKESEQAVARVKPRSMFGHVSEISHGDYTIQVPRMKRDPKNHPSAQSDFKCYQIKPHRRRRVETQSIEHMTEEPAYRAHIRIDPARYASAESTEQDADLMRLSKFKERNIKGHSSDSTVQRLLYGQKQEEQDSTDERHTVIKLVSSTQLEAYDDQFDFLGFSPAVDLLAGLGCAPFGGLGNYGISTNPDVSAHNYTSLPALLKRSIKAPLVAQIILVNESVVNYFTTELDLDGHLDTLRHFLLMEDGEFGQCLSEILFEKLTQSPQIHEVFNPMFLNNVLSSAMRASMHGDDKYAHNISFALHHLPTVLKPNAPNVLDCLELTYKVPWPMNIIITENSLTKYSRVFSFMLQLKRVVWVLKDVWHKLKRDVLVNRASAGYQFRQLQLYRHEMQYFVKVMQGYLANQIIHVTWLELRQDLTNNVRNLDDLHNCHGDYLNKCLSRCLLNKKAEPVMKIIQDIFGLILKLRMQLVSQRWQRDVTTGEVTHPAFEQMCATYDSFNNYSRFLFKVVRKLAIMGYQPHLQELLLRLNYNMYYSPDM